MIIRFLNITINTCLVMSVDLYFILTQGNSRNSVCTCLFYYNNNKQKITSVHCLILFTVLFKAVIFQYLN